MKNIGKWLLLIFIPYTILVLYFTYTNVAGAYVLNIMLGYMALVLIFLAYVVIRVVKFMFKSERTDRQKRLSTFMISFCIAGGLLIAKNMFFDDGVVEWLKLIPAAGGALGLAFSDLLFNFKSEER